MNFTFRIVTTGLAVSCFSIGAISIPSMQSAYGANVVRGGFHAPARIGMQHPDVFHNGMHPGVGNMRGGAMRNFDNRPGLNRIEHNNMARRDNWGGANGRNFDRRPGTDNFRRDDLAQREHFDRMKDRRFDRRPNMASSSHDNLAKHPDFDRHQGMDNSRRNFLARRDDFGRMRGHHFDRHPNMANPGSANYQSSTNTNPGIAAMNNNRFKNQPGIFPSDHGAATGNNNSNPVSADTGIHPGSYFKVGQ